MQHLFKLDHVVLPSLSTALLGHQIVGGEEHEMVKSDPRDKREE